MASKTLRLFASSLVCLFLCCADVLSGWARDESRLLTKEEMTLITGSPSILHNERKYNYHPGNVFAPGIWASRRGNNDDLKWFQLNFEQEYIIDKIGIQNGNGHHNDKFRLDYRIKDLTIELSNGYIMRTRLKDDDMIQYIDLPDQSTNSVSLTIESLYPTELWPDICIAELEIIVKDKHLQLPKSLLLDQRYEFFQFGHSLLKNSKGHILPLYFKASTFQNYSKASLTDQYKNISNQYKNLYGLPLLSSLDFKLR